MKQTIKKIAYSNSIFKFIYELMRKVKNGLLAIYSQLHKKICDKLPVKKNKIIFDNFGGQGYGGNPKYIAEEIIRQGLDYDLVWMVSDLNEPLPSQIRKVKINSLEAYYEWSTAKIWIDNVRVVRKPPKKNGQVYLQTWHGIFANKLIEADAENKLSTDYVSLAKKDGELIDAFFPIVNFDDSYNRKLFWLNDESEILHFGYPQHDVLFDEEKKKVIKAKTKNELAISNDTIAILYAPTFRDDGNHKQYIKSFEELIENFEARLDKKCVIIIKLHPNDKEYASIIHFNDKVLNATYYTDSQDLSIASDFLITDYSSIMYEFIVQNKPIFLYNPDLYDYENQRGLYPAYYQLPFPRAKCMDEFINIILKYDYKKFLSEQNDYFLKTNLYKEGKASCQTIEWLKHTIEA